MSKISFVIINDDAAEYCIILFDSLKKQKNLKNIELVFVDNHSADDSVKLASSFGISKIYSFNSKIKNRGVLYNEGIKLSSGDYIIFAHSDIYLKGDFFLNLSQYIKKNHKIDFVNFGQYYADHSFLENNYIGINTITGNFFYRQLFDFNPNVKIACECSEACFMVKRDIFKNNIFNTDYCNSFYDYDFIYNLKKDNKNTGSFNDSSFTHYFIEWHEKNKSIEQDRLLFWKKHGNKIINPLLNDLHHYKSQVEELIALGHVKDKSVCELNSRIQALQNEVEKLLAERAKNSELTNQLQAERVKSQELAKQFQAERAKNSELTNQLQAERVKSQELAKQFQAERAKNSELTNQLQAERVKSQEFAKQFQAERAKNSELTNQLQAERVKSQEFAKQFQAERAKNSELTNQLQAERVKSQELAKQFQAEQAKYKYSDIFLDTKVSELADQLQAEKTISNNLASQIKLIQSSVSYRIVQKLRHIKLLMVIYSFLRLFLKGLFRLVFKQHKIDQKSSIQSNIETPISQEIRDNKTRILLVSHYCPTRYHAGGLRTLDIYSILRQNFRNIQLDIYTIQRPYIENDYSELKRIFDRIYSGKGNTLTFAEFFELRDTTALYDIIEFHFLEATKDVDKFRHITKKIIFTPIESSLRNGLIAKNLKTICGCGFREIRMARKADLTICVSHPDSRMLKMFSRSKNIRELPTGLSPIEFKKELSSDYCPVHAKDKENIVIFLAYFGSPTNQEALEWYLKNVHQIMLESIPIYKFLIAGSGDLSRFSKYENEHLQILGQVDRIGTVLNMAKVSISPALSGSGFRGKINQYALCGLPCVATPLAASGLVYRNGKEIFIERSPKRFAEKIISLLLDNGLNQRIGTAARDICIKNYTWESKMSDLSKIYGMSS